MTDLEKLRVLLPHWLDHNRSHEEEYSNWATTLKKEKSDEAAALIEEAVEHMKKADLALTQTLKKLGGPAEHDHHHH